MKINIQPGSANWLAREGHVFMTLVSLARILLPEAAVPPTGNRRTYTVTRAEEKPKEAEL